MSTTFPRTRRSRLGYSVDQVEDFLEEARTAYAADRGEPTIVSAESIRRTAFDMHKGGYSTAHVDAALERLEDAFAARERDRTFAEIGDAAWYARARETAQAVLDRLDRPEGHRFDRTNFLSTGYHPKEVDAFADVSRTTSRTVSRSPSTTSGPSRSAPGTGGTPNPRWTCSWMP